MVASKQLPVFILSNCARRRKKKAFNGGIGHLKQSTTGFDHMEENHLLSPQNLAKKGMHLKIFRMKHSYCEKCRPHL